MILKGFVVGFVLWGFFVCFGEVGGFWGGFFCGVCFFVLLVWVGGGFFLGLELGIFGVVFLLCVLGFGLWVVVFLERFKDFLIF